MLPSRSASKAVKKLNQPRPLKILMNDNLNPSVPTHTSDYEASDDVLTELENLIKNLNNSIKFGEDVTLAAAIAKVCRDLKNFGALLEARNAVQLDRYFVSFRNAAGNERLDTPSRLHLLEIIELRASSWKGNGNIESYYRNKLLEAEKIEKNLNVTSAATYITSSPVITNINSTSLLSNSVPNPPPVATSVLSPGEVLKTSGKYVKPTKIPSKNYLKDEIVIRNSDSGKVAQGAKDRLVQITGPSDDCIGRAKQLIEETIRRNTSPIRDRFNPLQTSESVTNMTNVFRTDDLNNKPAPLMHSLSMNDAAIGEYQYTVNVGRDLLKLTGCRLDIVRIAKLVLEEYFAGDAKRTLHESVGDGDYVTYGTLEDYEEEEEEDEDEDDAQDKMVNDGYSCQRHLISSVSSIEERSINMSDFELDADTMNNIIPSWPERNGHRIAKSARITGRCISHDSTPDSDNDFYRKTEVRDEDDEESSDVDEDDDDDDLGERKLFNKPTTALATLPKYSYPRDVLLDCALSPYSRVKPKDLTILDRENLVIVKTKPEYFDPATYRKKTLSFNVGSGLTDRAGSSGSQDDDESAVAFATK